LANLQIRCTHSLSTGHHFPGTITAGDPRQGDVKAGHTAANPEIQMVDRHAEHTHEDLPRTGLGTRNIYNLKDTRIPVFCNVNGLHESEIY
jgi:hypothetical protein